MKIEIEIRCDTINEIYGHLNKIKEDIHRETKRLNLNPDEDEFPGYIPLDDANCYGEHTLKIK